MTSDAAPRAQRPRRALHLATLAGALAAVTGCAVKVQPSRSWTIPPASEEVRFDPAGPSVAVRDVAASSEILTTALTWRSHDGRRIERHPTEKWADYPDRLVEELLLHRLAASGRFSAVRAAPPTAGADAVLDCTVLDFTEWGGPGRGSGRVALRCDLLTSGGDFVGTVRAQARSETSSVSADGIAAAIAEAARLAVDQVVDETAARASEAR